MENTGQSVSLILAGWGGRSPDGGAGFEEGLDSVAKSGFLLILGIVRRGPDLGGFLWVNDYTPFSIPAQVSL